jgi:hypothetical protein
MESHAKSNCNNGRKRCGFLFIDKHIIAINQYIYIHVCMLHVYIRIKHKTAFAHNWREVTMPARVAHPGVEWIARNALPYMKKHSKEAPLGPPQTKQLTQGSQQVLTTGKDDEFKVIFRDGGFRLLKINWLGKRVADVPLPAGSNLTLVRHEGQPYLSSKGGTELYSCEEYVSHVMQAGPQVPG